MVVIWPPQPVQHIGEVYKLLLGLVGKELLEAVIDPSGRGFVLTYGSLKKSVYTGHPFCLVLQWEGARQSGGLRGPPLGVGSLEGSLGLLSRDFHPCTVMNPPSPVEGATEGVVMEADARLNGGSGGNLL